MFASAIPLFAQSCAGPGKDFHLAVHFLTNYSLPILLPTVVALLAVSGIVSLVQRHYEQSFAEELKDFIKGPKHVDKATNTENEEGLKQEEKNVKEGNLIDLSDGKGSFTPSASQSEEKVEKVLASISVTSSNPSEHDARVL